MKSNSVLFVGFLVVAVLFFLSTCARANEKVLSKLILTLSTQAVHEARLNLEYEEIYNQIALAFVRLQCPEFDQDSLVVNSAFEKAFEGNKLDDAWFKMMAGKVTEISGGKARLELAEDPVIFELWTLPHKTIRVVHDYGSTSYVITPTSEMGCEDPKIKEVKYSLLE